MKRKTWIIPSLILVAILLGTFACSQPSPSPSPSAKPTTSAPAPTSAAPSPTAAPKPSAAHAPYRMTVSGSGVNSTTWIWVTAMATLAEKYSPWLKVDVVPSKGTIEDMQNVINHKIELGAGYLWMAADAFKGIGGFANLGPTKVLRGFTGFQVPAGYVFVLDKSSITAFTKDQVKGKKIASREVGSMGLQYAAMALEGIGLDPNKDVKILTLNQADAGSAVLDGTADIYIGCLGFDYAAIKELASSKPVRFLDQPQSVLDLAKTKLGAPPGVIPANMYKGQTKDVVTSRPVQFFYVPDKLEDAVVTELLRLWWDYKAERDSIHPTIKADGTPEQLTMGVTASPDTPLHPAALKFYQSKGWIK
ncbi:MAG: TAXI family TRAP transporter solute-binding subunit [Dehalococcoidales bacterium]|nr:TAXI family TRAP transporter solute-binding subunit [Dehalococcoidales bacterium]